jgi:hypothetical protein
MGALDDLLSHTEKKSASALDMLAEQVPQEKPFGLMDTWPVKLAKGAYRAAEDAFTLPGDVYSGKQDVNSPDITGRALNFSAIATPGPPNRLRWSPSAVKAPSEKELVASGAAARDTVRDANVALPAEMVGQWSKWMEPTLLREGFSDASSSAPTTYALLRGLVGAEKGSQFTAANYIDLRRALQKTARNYRAGPDQAAATYALKALDTLFHKVDPARFVAGTPAEVRRVRQLLKNANADFAASYRSKDITNPAYAAELRAAAANSGRNLDNTTRQRLAGILIKEDEHPGVTGLNPAELAGTDTIVRGSRARNWTRYAGNLLQGGGGMGAAIMGAGGLAAAAATGDWRALAAGIGIPAAGAALKGIENALTRRDVKALANMIRLRSSLGVEVAEKAVQKSLPALSNAAQLAYRTLILPALQGAAVDEYQMANPNQS